MTSTLLRAVVLFVPVSLLVAWSTALWRRARGLGSALQLLGSGCLLVVVLTHVAEAVGVFPAMRWGQEDSAGHYLDLSSAILGITFVPLGYFIRTRTSRGR